MLILCPAKEGPKEQISAQEGPLSLTETVRSRAAGGAGLLIRVPSAMAWAAIFLRRGDSRNLVQTRRLERPFTQTISHTVLGDTGDNGS